MPHPISANSKDRKNDLSFKQGDTSSMSSFSTDSGSVANVLLMSDVQPYKNKRREPGSLRVATEDTCYEMNTGGYEFISTGEKFKLKSVM